MTQIQLYNSITQGYSQVSTNKEPIYWYVCGPTVYDSAHLGHARTYICTDIMRRWLQRKYSLILIMNITDIDDKIINRSKESNRNWNELSREWEEKFFQDMESLNVNKPDVITRVSDYIPEILTFISTLIDKKVAYVAPSGSVYFDVHQYINNGNKYHFRQCLVQECSESVDTEGEKEKQHPEDFALWKSTRNDDTVSWDSDWAKGRPGWHIECSAMAISVLKDLNGTGHLTIHSGGIDLAFPHHENEIIQSESYLEVTQGHPWVKIFSHIGHLHIEGKKMAKSLKNFITIRQFLDTWSPNVLRMMMLLTHYRQPMTYSEEYASYAYSEVNRIESYFHQMLALSKMHHKFSTDTGEMAKIKEIEMRIEAALDDDLNTVAAIKSINELIDIAYLSQHYFIKQQVLKIVRYYYDLLGFCHNTKTDSKGVKELVGQLEKVRNEIRTIVKSKDFSKLYPLSDKIRDDYLKGYNIQDLQ